MSLRKMPATVVLGLLACLLAHAALYGSTHAIGGAYSGDLIDFAMVAGAGLAALLGGIAWIGARSCADGSVVAARLHARLPDWMPVSGASLLWFVFGERIEPAHSGAGIGITLACLLAAAFITAALARRAVAVIAVAVVAICRSPFAGRTPPVSRRFLRTSRPRRSPGLRRRFTRPPPIASLCA